MIRDSGGDWASRKPYNYFVRAAEQAEASGSTCVDIADALVSIGVSWAAELHGARRLSQQLYLLSITFAARADREDAGGGAGGHVH